MQETQRWGWKTRYWNKWSNKEKPRQNK